MFPFKTKNFGNSGQNYAKADMQLFCFFLIFLDFFTLSKIMISRFSPPKYRYFTDQNGQKGGLHEKEF